MKMKILSLLLVLALIYPVSAAGIYDFCNVMDNGDREDLQQPLEAVEEHLDQYIDVDIRNPDLNDCDPDIDTMIQAYYDEYNYAELGTLYFLLYVDEASELTDWAVMGLEDQEDSVQWIQDWMDQEIPTTYSYELESLLKALPDGILAGFGEEPQEPQKPDVPSNVPEEHNTDYVEDRCALLSLDEVETLNGMAQTLYTEIGLPAYLLVVPDYSEFGSDPEDAARSYYSSANMGVGDRNSGILLLMSMENRKYALYAKGEANDRLEAVTGEISTAFKAYFKEDDWYGGFQSYFRSTQEHLSSTQDVLENSEFLEDRCDLLTAEQMEILSEMALNLYETKQIPAYLVIVPDNTELGSDAEDAARSYYSEAGMGVGDRDSGVLLLMSMENHQYALYAKGEANDWLEAVSGEITAGLEPYFEEGDWFTAFETYYAEVTDVLATRPEDPVVMPPVEPITFLDHLQFMWNDLTADSFPTFPLLVCLAIGLIIALVVVSMFKRQMHTAEQKVDAEYYVEDNGIEIHASEDTFLYRSESRRYIDPHPSSSDSGQDDSCSSGDWDSGGSDDSCDSGDF